MHDEEIEVKFYVRDLRTLEERLRSYGAFLAQPRILEQNLRFDTHDRQLAKEFKVLRLRRDARAHLTFKGPSEYQDLLRRFIFEDLDLRGEWVKLSNSWQVIKKNQHGNAAVQDNLGQAVAAVVLLSATIKFNGSINAGTG